VGAQTEHLSAISAVSAVKPAEPSSTADPTTHLVCFGTNHRVASTEFRERLMLASERLRKAGRRDELPCEASGLVVLSTCNRTELYLTGVTTHGDAWIDSMARRLGEFAGIDADVVKTRTYHRSGRKAIEHLCRVAAGLDSMVVGEAEILGQVAHAIDAANANGVASEHLEAVFRTAVRAGRRARAETKIGHGSASISSVAVGLARDIMGTLSGRRVLVVGTGKMGRQAVEAFHASGGALVTLANRTRTAAEELARSLSADVVGLDELEQAIGDADVVLTSTGSPDVLVDAVMVRRATKGRAADRRLVIIDIAVPHDVHPAVRTVPGVSLFGIDDLQDRIDENLTARRSEIPRVEGIIDEEIAEQGARDSRAAVEPLIAELRRWAETIRRQELDRVSHDAETSDRDAFEAFDELSRSLVHKILLQPTLQLRSRPETFSQDSYARIVRELFALEAAPSGRGR